MVNIAFYFFNVLIALTGSDYNVLSNSSGNNEESIIGTWHIVKMHSASCNGCGTVDFYQNNHGNYKQPSRDGKLLKFKYRLTGTRLILTSREGSDSIFQNGRYEYKIKFEERNDVIFMELIAFGEEPSFVFGCEK